MQAFGLRLAVPHLPHRPTAVDSWEDFVFVGTGEGAVVVYRVVVSQARDGSDEAPIARMDRRVPLRRGKRPVEQLAVLAHLHHVLALQDGQVEVLELDTLERASTLPGLKGASLFAVERDPHLTKPRVCVGLKKKVLLYKHESAGTFQAIKEFNLPDLILALEWWKPVAAARGDERIVAGHAHSYSLLDPRTGAVTTLPIPLERSLPIIKPCRDLLLLSADNFGFLVNQVGTPLATQIEWDTPPLAVGYRYPFVVGVQNTSIEVHNVYNQGLVQTIPLPSHVTRKLTLVSDNGRHLIVAGGGTIYCLVPTPVEEQVKQLLQELRVQEAADLLAESLKDDREGKAAKLSAFRQEAGMVYFVNLKFKEAFAQFDKSDMDPRELISFFPAIAPVHSTYTPLNAFNAHLIVQSKLPGESNEKARADVLHDAHEQLMKYLEARRREWMRVDESKRRGKQALEFSAALDTALIKLLAIYKPEAMEPLLAGGATYNTNELVQHLTEQKRWRALGHIYRHAQSYAKALDTWKRLGSEEAALDGGGGRDSDGVEESVNLLAQLSDTRLVFTYAERLFRSSPDRAVRVFVGGKRAQELDPEQVLEFLGPFGSQGVQTYLEFLVHDLKSEAESHHTRLALLYAQSVRELVPATPSPSFKPGHEPGLLGKVRSKLLAFLDSSDAYSVPALVSFLRDTPLHAELLVVYAKGGMHTQALDLLVNTLGDYDQAEAYCAEQARRARYAAPHHLAALSHSGGQEDEAPGGGGGEEEGAHLLIRLLQIYLTHSPSASAASPSLPAPALRLLNTYPTLLHPSRVLPLLPKEIPLASLSDYLARAVEGNVGELREGQVATNLLKYHHLQASAQLLKKRAGGLLVERETRCQACGKRIGDQVFAFFADPHHPLGQALLHLKCLQASPYCRSSSWTT